MFRTAFLQDLVDRAVRQALIILGPTLAAAAAGQGLDLDTLAGTGLAVAVGVGVTVVLAVSGYVIDPSAPRRVQLAERALKAGAGALAGLLVAGAGGGGWVLTVPWESAVAAASAAAVLSLGVNRLSPAPARDDWDLAA